MAIKIRSARVYQGATLSNVIVSVRGSFRIAKLPMGGRRRYQIVYTRYYFDGDAAYSADSAFMQEIASVEIEAAALSTLFATVYDHVRAQFAGATLEDAPEDV